MRPSTKSSFRTSTRWTVVANESTAEFYVSQFRNRGLRKEFELANDSSRHKLGDLISDSPGRSFDSHGSGRHSYSDAMDAKEIAAIRFADKIVDRIVRARQQGHIRDFAVIGAPRFLGHLREALSRKSIEDPHMAISKDVVGHDVQRIEKLLSASQSHLG